MKHTVVKKAALKAKSEELKIPFSNILAGYVLESLMCMVEDSAFANCLWLKNGYVLGVEQYRKETVLTLEFAYLVDDAVAASGEVRPGAELSLKMAYVILASVLKKEKIPEVKWRGRAAYDAGRVELEAAGEFAEMSVPLLIQIEQIHARDMVPEKKSIPLLMEKKQELSYLQYPWEMILAEQLFSIVQWLELISEMEAYAKVYEILGEVPVNGRHVEEHLVRICRKGQLVPNLERMEQLFSYRGYTYMRKRWERYLRSSRKKEPSWDQVMDRLEKFLEEIWRAICQDEVFVGDWMPELGRFLD